MIIQSLGVQLSVMMGGREDCGHELVDLIQDAPVHDTLCHFVFHIFLSYRNLVGRREEFGGGDDVVSEETFKLFYVPNSASVHSGS